MKKTNMQVLRILQCVLMLFQHTPEIEINKSFNFQEINRSKLVLRLINK